MVIIRSPEDAERHTKMVLITKAPTMEFIPFYNYSKNFSAKCARNILFSAGPPHDLINNVSKYLRKNGKSTPEEFASLFTIIESAYWTHMHLCPLENMKDFSETCADRMLEGQLQAAYDDGVRNVITVGRIPFNWVKDNFSRPGLNLVYFPDPTGRATVWDDKNHKGREELDQSIAKLMRICKK
jgi:hypothetical protein